MLGSEAIPVVICDRNLPDGSWRNLLEMSHDTRGPSRIIVSSRDADEDLWAEVLQSGAYDLLPLPWEASEVRRVIALAWRSWQFTRQAPQTMRALAAAAG